MKTQRVLAGMMLCLMAGPLFGQTAGMLSFQGLIKDAEGNRVNGPVNIEVRVFDTQGLGTGTVVAGPFFPPAATATNGILSFKFGPVPASAFDGTERWLEVSIDDGGGPVPLSRIEMATAPAAAEQLNTPLTGTPAMTIDPTTSEASFVGDVTAIGKIQSGNSVIIDGTGATSLISTTGGNLAIQAGAASMNMHSASGKIGVGGDPDPSNAALMQLVGGLDAIGTISATVTVVERADDGSNSVFITRMGIDPTVKRWFSDGTSFFETDGTRRMTFDAASGKTSVGATAPDPTGEDFQMVGTASARDTFTLERASALGEGAVAGGHTPSIKFDVTGENPTIEATTTLFLDAPSVCLGADTDCCTDDALRLGCNDDDCEFNVCAVVEFGYCCSTGWDDQCVAQAVISCPTLCGPRNLDVTGKLDVNGKLTIGTSSITIDPATDTITASSGTISFDDENLRTDGKVGIGLGILPVSGMLHVRGPSPTFSLNGQLNVEASDNTGAAGTGGVLSFRVHDGTSFTGSIASVAGLKENGTLGELSGYLAFNTINAPFGDSGERMRITSLGDVGIGTTVPSAHLEVRGRPDGTGGTIRVRRSGGGQWVEIKDSDSLGAFITGRSTVTNPKNLIIQNVFDGPGPPASANNNIIFRVGDENATTEVMRLTTDGDVGIGTDMPGAKLDVNGGIRHVDPIDFVGSDVEDILRIAGKQFIARHTSRGAVTIGADDSLVIGDGESPDTVAANVDMLAENTYISSDNNVTLITNIQNGWASRFEMKFTDTGKLSVPNDVSIGSTSSSLSRLLVTDDSPTSGGMVVFATSSNLLSGRTLLRLDVGPSSNDTAYILRGRRGTTTVFRVDADGEVVGGPFSCTNPDCFGSSAMMNVSGGPATVEPGDLMVIDVNGLGSGSMIKSAGARSTLVAGVCASGGNLATVHSMDELEQAYRAANPELYVGEPRASAASDGVAKRFADRASVGPWVDPSPSVAEMGRLFGEVPIATSGVVPCKVSAENGAIRPGDLLVTASTPGHAMRDANPKVGTLLGKALESLDKGTGTIRVLVTLH